MVGDAQKGKPRRAGSRCRTVRRILFMEGSAVVPPWFPIGRSRLTALPTYCR